ncbi:NUDIX hydrolase, partial [Patescibacteria group bacterium]
MQKNTPILCVDGVLVENGRVLLTKRCVEPEKNKWHLPGGVVDYGESVEKAIKRVMKRQYIWKGISSVTD